jgi:uncharacterized protein
MNFALSGLIIGLVMALTGAGGALIAIPLFMTFMGMSLKEASVLSLIAVVLASLISFIAQRKNTQYKTAISLIIFSTLGSYLSAPYKASLSDFAIAVLLSLVSLYALYNTWGNKERKGTNINLKGSDSFGFLSVPLGFALGMITTFTGLGGGVLMMPVLIGLYQFEIKKAVATSLLVVTLSSLSSLIIQSSRGLKVEFSVDLIFMIVGIFMANYLIKFFIKKLSEAQMGLVRKTVFTLVVIIALIKIF